jgi:hypothetical protein
MTEQQEPETDDGAPSNAELAERMARVEEGVDHVETKLDYQGDTLERIEGRLADDLDAKADRLDGMEPKVRQLWLIQQAAKWLIMVGSGGGVLALLLTLGAGAI